MKQLFYLNDEIEYYDSVEDELISWIYRWTAGKVKHTAYSTDLRELIETNYYTN